MSDPTVTPFLQTLLDNGRLGSPITFDNAPMAAAAANATPPPGYDAHGWGLVASEIGGRRSKGVDALIAELVSAGCDPAIVDEVSTQHIVRSWGAPEAFGFAVRDNRFDLPDPATTPPLTAAQIYQIVHNLVRLDNRVFIESWQDPRAAQAWRGQAGQAGYAPIKLDTGHASTWVQSGLTLLDVAAQFVPPAIKFLAALGLTGPYMWGKVDPSKHYPDHNVYNVFIDTRDDAAITRMWRSWVIAVGARISA